MLELGQILLERVCQCKCFTHEDFNASCVLEFVCECDKNPGLENIIFFDTKDQVMQRNSIPDALMINDKIYHLFAIIERIQFVEKSHFTANIKRKNNQWQHFDQNSKGITKSKWKKNMNVHIVGFKHEESKRTDRFESTWAKIEDTDWPIIRNFHTFIFKDSNVKVNNSCGPDSILHSLCYIYHATPTVFGTESFQSSEMMALLKAYAGRNETEVYEHRIKLLMKSGFKISFNVEAIIDADSNIECALRMLCLPHLASGTIVRKCKCGTRTHELVTIEVDMSKLVKKGLERLDTCFVTLKTTQTQCKKCRKNINSTVNYSRLIFIGIEPVISGSYNIQLPNQTLDELPKQIKLDSKLYNLQAAIQYHRNIKHYSTHCMMKGAFIEFDDLNLKATPSKTNKMEIHFLIFTDNSE